MQKQKKGFLLFISSLIPGAGEMYMGFFKQGISIMTLFWAIIAIAGEQYLLSGYLSSCIMVLQFLPCS